MSERVETTAQSRWRVRYYDHRRRGIWVATFNDEAKAVAFAEGKRLYAKPARVEPIAGTKAAQ